MNVLNTYKHNNIILIIIFGLVIYIPLIIGVIKNDKISSQIEKRNLAKLPEFPQNISKLSQFPDAFNEYYADHFGLRELLTKVYFKIISKIDQSSGSLDVTFGKDGWLFLGSIKPGYTRYDDPMGDVTNINLYSEQELKTFIDTISQIKKWLDKQGIEYVYAIAPNKHTIYYDKLPNHIIKQNKYSATDQLIDYIKTHTDINVIDLRRALFKAKKNHQLYYKTDTHWNYLGANIAQFEIIKEIEKIFPGKITANLLKPSQFKQANYDGGDLTRLAKIENINENDPRPIFENACEQKGESVDSDFSNTYSSVCKDQLLTALIFRDSFFKALQPYFSRKFKQATYVPDRLNLSKLKKHISKNKPDIVIDQIVERALPYLPETETPEQAN